MLRRYRSGGPALRCAGVVRPPPISARLRSGRILVPTPTELVSCTEHNWDYCRQSANATTISLLAFQLTLQQTNADHSAAHLSRKFALAQSSSPAESDVDLPHICPATASRS